MIFSARRSTCCVIFSDRVGVGVVLTDVIFSDKCRLRLSSLFLVKVLNRSQTHAFSNNHMYFCLVARRDIVFIPIFFFSRHLIISSLFSRSCLSWRSIPFFVGWCLHWCCYPYLFDIWWDECTYILLLEIVNNDSVRPTRQYRIILSYRVCTVER